MNYYAKVYKKFKKSSQFPLSHKVSWVITLSAPIPKNLKVFKHWVSAAHFFLSRFFVVSPCYNDLLGRSLEKSSKNMHDLPFIYVYRELHSNMDDAIAQST